MSNARKIEKCPHDRYGFEDCDACAEQNVVDYIARRVTEEPALSAADVLAEIRAGKVGEVSPEQQVANVAAWLASLDPETRAMMEREEQ